MFDYCDYCGVELPTACWDDCPDSNATRSLEALEQDHYAGKVG